MKMNNHILANLMFQAARKLDASNSLEAAADADQTAILRLFKKNNRESMSVRELEALREGQTPWFKAWLKEQAIQDKKQEITPEQIKESTLKLDKPNVVEESIESRIKTKTISFSAVDTALKQPTKAWIMYMDSSAIEDVFGIFGNKAVEWLESASGEQMREMQRHHGHEHPNAGPHTMTLGWVRYTPLSGSSLWVEEIQSDVKSIVGARHVLEEEAQRIQRDSEDMFKANEEMHRIIKSRLNEMDKLLQGMEWMVFKTFIEEHYQAKQIILPTHQYRAELPGYTSNPASVYNELPRKARMTKKHVKDIIDISGIPDREVWVASYEP